MVGMSMAEDVAWSAAAYRACHDRLVSEGANLSAYSFIEITHDVAAFSAALGYDKIVLYGVSYGTTPAMLAMRLHPEILQSVILDSVVPPDSIWSNELATNMQAAVDQIFAACAADTLCAENYPDLPTVFAGVLTTLRQEPALVNLAGESGEEFAVTVDDIKFVHFVYETIFVGDGFTLLPAIVYAAQHGEFDDVAAGWLDYVDGQHGPANAAAGAWAKGMTYSALCLQDGSVTDMATATALYQEANALPSVQDWGMTHFLGEWLEPCEYWAVTSPDPNITVEPVVSDIATLMIAGIFDPETPPSLSRASAQSLPNSYYFEIPSGHGAILTSCALDLINQFLADPTQQPEASCIDAMTPAWVLPD
jgi:pimeloyl-ACP methyl ester carboxylesterase